MTTRADIVLVARRYLGTPFHHAARSPGIGIDCGGLVICVARELGIWAADFDVEPYSIYPDGSSLRSLCVEHLVRVAKTDIAPGHVLLLAMNEQPQHLGIIGDHMHGGLSLIHASNARSVQPARVIEQRLVFDARNRFVAAFAFPGVA